MARHFATFRIECTPAACAASCDFGNAGRIAPRTAPRSGRSRHPRRPRRRSVPAWFKDHDHAGWFGFMWSKAREGRIAPVGETHDFTRLALNFGRFGRLQDLESDL